MASWDGATTGQQSNRQGYAVTGGTATGRPAPPPADPSQTTATDQVASGTGFVLDIQAGSSVVVVGPVQSARQVTLQNIGVLPIFLVGGGTNLTAGERLSPGDTLQLVTRQALQVYVPPLRRADVPPTSNYHVQVGAWSVGRLAIVL